MHVALLFLTYQKFKLASPPIFELLLREVKSVTRIGIENCTGKKYLFKTKKILIYFSDIYIAEIYTQSITENLCMTL